MTEARVSRWCKYGKDRLYVSTADGVRIGWLDSVSGERVIERPDLKDIFDAALAREGRTPPSVAPAASQPLDDIAPHEPPLPPQLSGPMWVDLAQNKPGQAVREQATAERELMRERSKIRTFVARVRDEKTAERAWRVGAGGEEAVAAELARLEKHGWRTLHAVVVGERGRDIDHVVIGPGGVFTVNTKAHLGARIAVYERAIYVAGCQKHYIAKSRHEAADASRLLTAACGFPVHAAPLIVVLCAELIVKQQPADVQVVGRRDIALWLRKRPTVLGASEVEAIWEHARRSTTWPPSK